MTNPLTPEPPPPQHRRRDDEWIAAIVAFSAIAALLFWILGDKESQWGLKGLSGLFAPASAPVAPSSPSPIVSGTPAPTVQPLLPRLLGRETVPTPDSTTVVVPSPSVTPTPLVPVPVAPARVESKTTSTGIQFKDVPPNHWAHDAIIALAERGIVAGFTDGTFRPERPITRAEFAAIVRDVLPDNTRRPAIQFKDIEPGFWAAPDIDLAVEKGFMKGYPGQIFKPAQQIPRLEALVALSAGLDLQPPPNPKQVLEKYPDRDKLPAWATNSVASASIAELVVNPPDKAQLLEPQRPATRADVAAMLYQVVERSPAK
ncbi:S-layer homology domain-containing protein [Oscillatoria sp. FACHB-1406]|uniref:S-layer homology domain-containing protein n=1 Tax=Oscillatoria sp. FACHB-1406 TaxID=2692846 RepID=UPI001684DE83|nr:S-layer homology domain-containing protein [Oscillatoria sp. FACHB-1406]MBD2580366.1 S-layer homology domain-containing protein [Oscillatoria sp. FACHB-1406]